MPKAGSSRESEARLGHQSLRRAVSRTFRHVTGLSVAKILPVFTELRGALHAAGASPQRAVTAAATPATDKRPAARRVFEEKAIWLRCSSVTARWRGCSLLAPCHLAFSSKTGPHLFLNTL